MAEYAGKDNVNGVADSGATAINIADLEAGSSSDDEGMFVRQPGDMKMTDSVIDLTQETEAESDARALRVGSFLPENPKIGIKQEDLKIKIKEEEKKIPFHQILESTNIDAANLFTPEDLEEIFGKREMLEIEQRMLQKRQGKNALKPADQERLEALGWEIAELDKSIEELLEMQDEAQPPKAEPANAAEAFYIAETSQEERSADGVLAAPSGRAERKRKATPQHKGRATKKPRQMARSRKKGRNAAQESAKIILEMLHDPNPIMGHEIADLPVLDRFEARTAAEQARNFREQAFSRDPNTDKKKYQGDKMMVQDARSVLKRRVRVAGEKFLIRNMKTPLFAYQFAGVGWMVRREKSSQGPNGGILADSMGLGKTVETLACIAGNPPSEEDLKNGLQKTLVVAPANAVSQWVDEIFKHCEGISACSYKMSDSTNQAMRENASIW